jgi:hypothetical protein
VDFQQPQEVFSRIYGPLFGSAGFPGRATESAEARAFEQAGLNYAAVQEARRREASRSLLQAAAKRGESYQLSLPGMNPTLMALRSPLGLSPQEMAAAGVVGYGWQRSPEAVGQQMELSLGDLAVAANARVPLRRPSPTAGGGGRPPGVPPISPINLPPGPAAAGAMRLAGARLPQLLAYALAGAGGAAGSWLSWDDGGTQS